MATKKIARPKSSRVYFFRRLFVRTLVLRMNKLSREFSKKPTTTTTTLTKARIVIFKKATDTCLCDLSILVYIFFSHVQ